MKCINPNAMHRGGTCAHCGKEFSGTGECPNELCQIREKTVVPFGHACSDCGQVYPVFNWPEIKPFLVFLGISVLFLLAPFLVSLLPDPKKVCPFFAALGILAFLISFVIVLVEGVAHNTHSRRVIIRIIGLGGIFLFLGAVVFINFSGAIWFWQSLLVIGFASWGALLLIFLLEGLSALHWNVGRYAVLAFLLALLSAVISMGALCTSAKVITDFCYNLQVSGAIILGIIVLIFLALCALSIQPRRMWRIIWEVALAILLMLIGIFSFSGTFFFLGLTVLATWFVSQKCYKRLFELNEEQLKADKEAKDYERIPRAKTAETNKRLKDLKDAVQAKIWEINYVWAKRWFFRCLGLTAILAVLFFSGPGEYLYRDAAISGIKSTGAKIKNALDFSGDIQPEVRQATRNLLVTEFQAACFSQEQIDEIFALGNVLLLKEVYSGEQHAGVIPAGMYDALKGDFSACNSLTSKGLTVEQFFQLKPLLDSNQISTLLDKGYPSAALVKDSLEAGVQGKLLFDLLKNNVEKPAAPVCNVALFKTIMQNAQLIRRTVYPWTFILLMIALLIDVFFCFYMVVSFAAHKAFQATDELLDYAHYAWEKIQEKEKKKKDPHHTPSQGFQDLTDKVSEHRSNGKVSVAQVFMIDAAMELGQMIWKKLQPEFAHKIAVA